MRCFILGNSGELLDHDLSLLKGEEVFASNCFPLRFPEIITHYVCMDVVMGMLPEIRAKVPKTAKKYYSRLVWNCIYEEEGVNVYDCYPDQQIGFSISTEKVYPGRTVSYVMLQLAAALGYETIYMLGVDIGLPANGIMHIPEQEVMMEMLKQKNLANPTVDKRVHDPSHEEYTKPVQKNFILARAELDKAGIDVFNLSRGGNLGAFKRMSFEEVVGHKETANVR